MEPMSRFLALRILEAGEHVGGYLKSFFGDRPLSHTLTQDIGFDFKSISDLNRIYLHDTFTMALTYKLYHASCQHFILA
jgi:hypothetical protein